MWFALFFVHVLSWTTAVHGGDENVVRFVSLRPDLNLHQLEYLDFHTNILRRRAQIEQTTGHMLHLINQKRLVGLQIMPPGPIHYSRAQHPDWTYEAYLIAEEAKSLVAETSELPWKGNVNKDVLIVKSIMHSNCGEHVTASALATSLIEVEPSNAFYRYLFSEVLSRQDQTLIPDALGQINLAILLNSTEPLYREKRISLFILNGQIKNAADDARWLRQQLNLYLRDKYCSYCVRKRVKKPIDPMAWRHWMTLAMYNLLAYNTTQAERDLTIALDLASAARYANKSEVITSVTSTLRHLKAIALHNNGKLQHGYGFIELRLIIPPVVPREMLSCDQAS
ncbi:unnamed protein product [Echinostoma caproni]|uniref:Alginate_lyase domain-containing protein n=1 Tax=Echinostoma caproni TaxID=27848 RepID=A0A183APG7_9TREM|nr:unnamed protein product [Echinostoma caproni]